MSVRITLPGSSSFVRNQRVPSAVFSKERKRITAEGGIQPKFQVLSSYNVRVKDLKYGEIHETKLFRPAGSIAVGDGFNIIKDILHEGPRDLDMEIMEDGIIVATSNFRWIGGY